MSIAMTFRSVLSKPIIIILSITAAVSCSLVAESVHAGPPSFSRGGSFNWQGVVNQAIRGAQQARAYSSPNYGHQRSYTPRYGAPQYSVPQSRRYSTTPHYNTTPRYNTTPTYRTPTRNYVTPTPRTNVTPRRNNVPHSTITRRSNVVPRANTITDDARHSANQLGSEHHRCSNDSRKKHVAGILNNAAVPRPLRDTATPLPNTLFDDTTVNLTQADINNIVGQLDERDLETLADIRQLALEGLDDVIDQIPNVEDDTERERELVREAVRTGDPDRVRELLTEEAEDSPAGRELINRATAVGLIDDIATAIRDGALNGADIAALGDGVQLFPPAIQPDVLNGFAQIAVNQQVVVWLQAAAPGLGPCVVWSRAVRPRRSAGVDPRIAARLADSVGRRSGFDRSRSARRCRFTRNGQSVGSRRFPGRAARS